MRCGDAVAATAAAACNCYHIYVVTEEVDLPLFFTTVSSCPLTNSDEPGKTSNRPPISPSTVHTSLPLHLPSPYTSHLPPSPYLFSSAFLPWTLSSSPLSIHTSLNPSPLTFILLFMVQSIYLSIYQSPRAPVLPSVPSSITPSLD